MGLRLKERGRYYELPIEGARIKEIIYSGLITVVFNDADSSYLELHGNFEIIRYNQKSTISPRDKEAFLLFYDLFSICVKEAKADRQSRLSITFENDFELTMNEVGPFEAWHFTKINSASSGSSLHVHGGSGKLIF